MERRAVEWEWTRASGMQRGLLEERPTWRAEEAVERQRQRADGQMTWVTAGEGVLGVLAAYALADGGALAAAPAGMADDRLGGCRSRRAGSQCSRRLPKKGIILCW